MIHWLNVGIEQMNESEVNLFDLLPFKFRGLLCSE